MSEEKKPNRRPTVGLALSGAGNRSSFYVGFLEELANLNIPINYISACSGASIAAAAFACGTLKDLKSVMLNLDNEGIKNLIEIKGLSGGGLYSLDKMEEKLRQLTGGKNFEDVDLRMSFTAVDINSGEVFNICMGDIARAARISCTLPALFEPVAWGSKILVDGGLLVLIPTKPLYDASIDIKIGINMRGTKHIFTESHMNLRRAFILIKKILLINWWGRLLEKFFWQDFLKLNRNNFFAVLGRSLDLAIKANQSPDEDSYPNDLVITPNFPKFDRYKTEGIMKLCYEKGREVAREQASAIRELIEQKKNKFYD